MATWTCSSRSADRPPATRPTIVLFQNPGNDHHWIKAKMIGTKTNRAAVGAKIRVDIESKDGRIRSIYRTVGNNSSFGGNSLVQSIGLLDATHVTALTVTWPTSRSTQVFGNLAVDQTIEIVEGTATYRALRQKTSMPPDPLSN